VLALGQAGGAPRVLDLGCGTGELTRRSHERLGARETPSLGWTPAAERRARGTERSTPRPGYLSWQLSQSSRRGTETHFGCRGTAQ